MTFSQRLIVLAGAVCVAAFWIVVGWYGVSNWLEPPKRKIFITERKWSELCAKVDCAQFPIGYLTIKAGGMTIYSKLNPRKHYGGHLYREYITEPEHYSHSVLGDSITRAVHPFCKGCTSGKTAMFVEIYPTKTRLTKGIGYTRINSKKDGYVEYERWPPKDLAARNYYSLGKHFWLAKMVWRDVHRKDPRIVYISKEPILQGMFVVGSCVGLGCGYAYTVPDNSRPHVVPRRLRFRFTNVYFRASTTDQYFKPKKCGPASDPQTCTLGEKGFDIMANKIFALDKRLTQLRIKPDTSKGKPK